MGSRVRGWVEIIIMMIVFLVDIIMIMMSAVGGIMEREMRTIDILLRDTRIYIIRRELLALLEMGTRPMMTIMVDNDNISSSSNNNKNNSSSSNNNANNSSSSSNNNDNNNTIDHGKALGTTIGPIHRMITIIHRDTRQGEEERRVVAALLHRFKW